MIRACIALLLILTAAAPAGAQSALSWPRDAASVRATCANAGTQLKSRVAAIAARRSGYTFANTILPLENAFADARDRAAAERFLWSVAQDDALIAASRDCRTSLQQTTIDVLADNRLYAAVARAANTAPHNPFDRALSSAWVDRLKDAGAAQSRTRRDRYAGSAHELAAVEDTFWRNLARDRSTIRIDARQARGLPADLLAAFVRNRDGSFVVPVDAGTHVFLRYESDADARKAFYRAYNRRAAQLNVALLERAIALRDRIAHALGVESWADYRLRATPLRGYAQAARFLTAAGAAYASGRPPQATAPWDLEREEAGSDVPVRSLDDAVGTIGSAFGMHFARSAQEAWAPGVARYDVSDESSERPLGTIYVDLARRSGKQTDESAYAILRPRAAHPGVVAVVASWPARNATIDGDRLANFYRLTGRAVALLLPAVPYETLARVAPESEQTVAAIFERFARADAPTARSMLAQTVVAQIDLAYSSSGSHVDTSAVWQRLATATFTPLYDPGTFPQAATDDFIDGAAGLLVLRPWSQTYAADLYGSLANDGRFDSTAAQRFRRTVLAPGATRSFEDEMREFLGRDPHSVMP